MPRGIYIRTEEHNKKIGLTSKGRFKGRTYDQIYGLEKSKEIREKRSKTMRGSKTHLWKGGVNLINNTIRNIYKYRQWRSDVFHRDNFTCQFCGKWGGILNADHIKSVSEIIKKYNINNTEDANNCMELWDINNGRTLCLDCHKKTDNYAIKAARINVAKK
jgi:hypothetical protein